MSHFDPGIITSNPKPVVGPIPDVLELPLSIILAWASLAHLSANNAFT